MGGTCFLEGQRNLASGARSLNGCGIRRRGEVVE